MKPPTGVCYFVDECERGFGIEAAIEGWGEDNKDAEVDNVEELLLG
jgi:hypothetical protein